MNEPEDFDVLDVAEHACKLAECTIYYEDTNPENAYNKSFVQFITIPDKGKNGEDTTYKGRIDPISGWYNDYYALGLHDSDWFSVKRVDNIINYINRHYGK